MRRSLGRAARYGDGYTLIELAVSMVIIGLLVIPVMAAYALYVKEQRAKD